jgi:probable HAF family extracellular repeat protein
MHRAICKLALSLSAVALLGFPTFRTTAAQNSMYSITDLGTLPGGNYSYPTGINPSGHVVGLATTSSGAFHAFLWQNGAMTDLGTLGGFSSIASDINNTGQVAGISDTVGDGPHLFLYSNGIMQDLNIQTSGLAGKVGMNDSAQLVCQLPNQHGFLYSSGVVQDLGTFGGPTSQAAGINNKGEICGFADPPSGVHHTFIYSGGMMHDLGPLSDPYQNLANELNEAGQIVGYVCQNAACTSQHPGLWQKDLNGNYMFVDLGTLPGGSQSNAVSINNSGVVVGGSDTAGGAFHGFIYDSLQGMQDLNDLIPTNSGWALGQANDINDGGQIVGVGSINGQRHAYLLTPVASNRPPTAVCHDVTLAAGSACTATASIDAGSFDPDGDTITVSQSPPGPYPLGTTLVTLTATDPAGLSSSCTATVTVVDQTPPAINSASASPNSLWPPNHKMVPVTVTATTTDNCGAVSCKIISVARNEPAGTDAVATGDAVITGSLTLNLRAERLGNGSGRIYTILIQCADGSGNSATKTVTVGVPHDREP